MKPYLSAFKLRFRLELTYRAAALGGLATQVFFGFIYIFLYRALYASSGVTGEPVRLIVTYVWLQQAFFRMLLSSDGELVSTIITGGMAYQLCRPVNQYAYWYARAVAQKLVGSLLRAVPMLLIAALLPAGLGLSAPASAQALLLSLLALAMGLLCVCALDNIAHAATLKTLDHRGVSAMLSLLLLTLSGNVLPLTLFPDRWQRIIFYTPYAQLLDAPIRLYTGQYAPSMAAETLAVQAVWLVLLLLLGALLWKRNLSRIIIQGG